MKIQNYFDSSESEISNIEDSHQEDLKTLKENLELEYLWQIKKDYDDYLNDYPEFY
jgi:patatin-like phospholipase/acyl hydrolase